MSIPRVPFYLMRHGETFANKFKTSAGWLETPLTRLGVQQAKDVNPIVAKLDISTVYHSTLNRARDTALHATANTGLEMIANPDLREANFGKYEGESYDMNSIEDWLNGLRDDSTMGLSICENPGESFATFKKRIVRGLTIILPNHQSGHPPLLVCHGAVFWAIYSLVGHTTHMGQHIDNCALIRLDPIQNEGGDDSWSITLLHPSEKTLFKG